jgi:lipoprotein-releasing system ATP-binding protein
MSDDLARVFSRPSGTFRPPVMIRSRASAGPSRSEPRPSEVGASAASPVVSDGVAPTAPLAAELDQPAEETPHASNPGAYPLEVREALLAAQDGSAAPTPLMGATPSMPPASSDYQLEAVGLAKSYRKAAVEIPVLRNVNLAVRRGEFLAIVGQSGSGKSTLLHLLGTLDAPDAGSLFFEGQRIDNLPAAERDRLRNHCFGMIFQFYHLLPELTTLENVLTPLMIGKSVWGFLRRRRAYRKAAEHLLGIVGLSHRLKHRPRELSGGEMQRAAIARALIAGPDVLLADEPTGNLDRATGLEILELLCSLNRQENLTIVMVTHDLAIAERADRIVRLVDGQIVKY